MVIAAVREQRVGLAARPSDAATDGRDRVEQGQQLGDVVAIATGQQDPERSAVSVGDEVVFRAGPPTIDRGRARLAPPFSALTCEESTTQRDQSSREAALSSASSTSCKRCQTPASFQSCNLRQHVMPERKPSSCGRCSHWIPVCSTYRIPQSTSRSGSGLRPGYRKRRSRCGSNGAKRSHSSSDTIHGDVPTRRRTLNSHPRHGRHRLPTSLC